VQCVVGGLGTNQEKRGFEVKKYFAREKNVSIGIPSAWSSSPTFK